MMTTYVGNVLFSVTANKSRKSRGFPVVLVMKSSVLTGVVKYMPTMTFSCVSQLNKVFFLKTNLCQYLLAFHWLILFPFFSRLTNGFVDQSSYLAFLCQLLLHLRNK